MSLNSEISTAEVERTPYEMIGGEAAVRKIVDRFYDIMDSVPEAASLRAMHADDLSPMRERLSEFLNAWLGGPRTYFERGDRPCIMSAHRPFAIGEAERDAWMTCMRRALEDCGVSEDMLAMLDRPFLRMCEAFRNR
jgi:hemoglobin